MLAVRFLPSNGAMPLGPPPNRLLYAQIRGSGHLYPIRHRRKRPFGFGGRCRQGSAPMEHDLFVNAGGSLAFFMHMTNFFVVDRLREHSSTPRSMLGAMINEPDKSAIPREGC